MGEAQGGCGGENLNDTFGGLAAFRAEQGEALGEEFGDGAGEEVRVVGTGERVEIAERKATPRGAKGTEPGNTVEWIEEGAGEGEGVQNFRANGELFEIDGAEGNLGCAEGQGNGSEGVAGAAEDGDAEFLVCIELSLFVALPDALPIAFDQSDDFVDLG